MKLFIDMDGVLCDFDAGIARRRAQLQYPQSKEGFFLNLEPIPGAVEAMQELLTLPVELFILTAPSSRNPHCWTEKAQWIEKHLGFEFLSQLIITERKELLFNTLDFSFLVDDFDSGKGQEVWARNSALIKFGSRDYPDWKAVLYFIRHAIKYDT